MSRFRPRRTSGLAFNAITVEGALIAPAMLARIAQRQADAQKDADYKIPKGLTLRDEIARYFRIGQAMFRELTVTETPSTTATVNFVENLLREVFGFASIYRVGTRVVGDRQFAITLECLGGRVPIVVVPPADDLDRASTHVTTDGRRRSAASALQDMLNAGEGALWVSAQMGCICASSVTTQALRGRRISRLTSVASSMAMRSQILRHCGCSFTPVASAPLELLCRIVHWNAGARPLRMKALPRATSCAMGLRLRCSVLVTGSCRTPATNRCESNCAQALCRCPNSLVSFYAWSIG